MLENELNVASAPGYGLLVPMGGDSSPLVFAMNTKGSDVTRFLSLLLLGCIASGAVAADGETIVREEAKNSIGGEIMGRGLVLTLNYERWIDPHVGLGAGLMAISADGEGVIIVPLYVSYVTGNRHSLYLSAGMTSFSGGDDISDYETANVATFAVGYQYQSESGFFIRPMFSYLNVSDIGDGSSGLIWPGITIGGSF